MRWKIFVLISFMILVACGQKGPLYLPTPPEAEHPQQELEAKPLK